MSKESDADYQRRMDRLALRIGEVLDGEANLDIATVLAGLAAFAIASTSPSIKQRERLLDQIVEFMDRQIHKDVEPPSEH